MGKTPIINPKINDIKDLKPFLYKLINNRGRIDINGITTIKLLTNIDKERKNPDNSQENKYFFSENLEPRIKKYIKEKMQNKYWKSGLRYLEYWIQPGIHTKNIQERYAEVLVEISLVILKTKINVNIEKIIVDERSMISSVPKNL